MSRTPKSQVEIARDTHRNLNMLPLPALSQREIVERVLHLANQSVTDQQIEEAQLVSMLSHGFTKTQIEKLAKLHGSDFLQSVWRGLSTDREAFRKQLQLVLENREKARGELRDQVTADLGDVVPVPELSFTDDWKVETNIRYFALSLPAACAFALALLLDESTGLGAALKQCKLAPLCTNFFFEPPLTKRRTPTRVLLP